ncbi:MAG: membrane dipeptidase, partial [Pyramidobacter sp.]|nr:membrane dipeptidase [Pyramidobacter sp.]
MYPTALIDLHCDTLTDWKYTSTGNPDTLDDPKRVLSLSAIPDEVRWAQFYAVFIPDEVRGNDAIEYFESNRQNFLRQMTLFADRVAPCRTPDDMEAAWKKRKTAAFLTVENGSALAGKIERVHTLAEQGVRCMTLVWNGENEIGSGHTTEHGLSAFGKEVIPEMEKEGILVDVSHLNDPGFEDLFAVDKKPFVATHSNALSVCSHKRNLTDDMIREMVKRNCLIGLNYFVKFLADD